MDRGHTCNELLAHFDHPKTLAMPEFDGVDELLSNESPALRIDYFTPTPLPQLEETECCAAPKRGVGWVLKWAAAAAVQMFAAGILFQFTCGIAAEHQLAIAARAGAIEATLPRATYETVTATIERRLIGYPRLVKELHIGLEQNGSLVQQQFFQHEDDEIAVTLWAPSTAAAPAWLQRFVCNGDSRIQARAESKIPGRKLAFRQ
jgi:hypothetical protein